MIAPNQQTTISLDLIDYYANLRWHRCVILEGIRQIAFRNMAHLSNVMSELGTTRQVQEAYVVKVQNRMLEDQNLKTSKENRVALGMATWRPWEIYLCLLYAEIENYQTCLGRVPSLVYQPLEQFLKENAKFLRALKDFRHGLLHPGSKQSQVAFFKQVITASRKIYISYQHLVRILQNLIDDYLEWMQQSLTASLKEQISHLNPRESQHWNLYLASINIERSKESPRIQERGEVELWEIFELEHETCYDDSLKTTPFTPAPEFDGWCSKMYKCTIILSGSLPERSCFSKNVSTEMPNRPTQTPINSHLISFFFLRSVNMEAPEETRNTRNLRQNMRRYIHFIGGAFVLLCESNFASNAKDSGSSTDETFSLGEAEEKCSHMPTGEDDAFFSSQQEYNIASEIRVACALLYEPVRVCKPIIDSYPNDKAKDLKGLFGDEVVGWLRLFRNLIFHVPKPKINPAEAEYNIIKKLGIRTPMYLIPALNSVIYSIIPKNRSTNF